MNDHFHNVRFPSRLAITISGGPENRVDTVRLASGHERRNARWSAPMRRYILNIGSRPLNEIKELSNFFEERSGPLFGFRFKDPFHNSTAHDEQPPTAYDVKVAVGDNKTSVFDMKLSNGRQIKKPVAGTVQVALNGAIQTSGFFIDYDQGNLSFKMPPAVGTLITMGCEFDVPVRFENNQLLITRTAHNAGEVSDITLTEIRV